MNTVRPRPYPQGRTGSYNAGSDGADKDGHNSNPQEQRQQQGQQQAQQEQNPQVVARGRASDVQEIQQYSPATNPYPTPSRSAYPAYTPMPRMNFQPHQINAQQYQALQSGHQPIQQQGPAPSAVPQRSQRSNKVNIAQILKDFRNTIKAIATPPEIEEQVNRYLQIVEEQVREAKPQVNLIQSNLKIAAGLLDKYISETLNKESKVVQNWLDALFLQRINYSYNEEEINPSFLVKFPDETEKKQTPAPQAKEQERPEEPATQVVPTAVDESGIIELEEYQTTEVDEQEFTQAQQKIVSKPNITIVPQDTRLKSLYMEAKKQAFSNNPQKAMAIFKEAFNRASELNDGETQSRICLEIGKIYDDNDFVVQALNSYNKSLQYTTDTNVKSKAHFSMAQIYDDVNQVEPALNHYMTSISYAGKSDDLIGQSDSLTRVGNIFTDKYEENTAFDYYDVARKLVEQTADDNMKGYVLSNTADACVHFRKNDKALKYYAEAVKNYEKTNALEEIAQNYKSAAELMIQFNSPNKAKALLKKAIVNSVKTQNEDLTAEINLLLASL